MPRDDAGQVSSAVCYSEIDSRYTLNEATPLLRGHSRQPLVVNDSERTDALLEAVAAGDERGLQPDQLPELKEATSRSSSNTVVNEDSSEDDDRTAELVWTNSPYLCGVSKRRFWILFLGILLQYFVRA